MVPTDLASPLILTASLATITMLILIVLATPLAWWLATSTARWKDAVGALVAMPLILPPTVIGFYLLIALGPGGPGGLIASLWGGRTLAFSFEGLVIGSVIYALPFMVQPIRLAFEAIGKDTLEAAATLGAAQRQTFFRVVVPMSLSGFLLGAVLVFAHVVGEFGVVLMIGGNLPGETKVLSIAIFDFIERGDWRTAQLLALGMVGFAFLVVTTTLLLGYPRREVRSPHA